MLFFGLSGPSQRTSLGFGSRRTPCHVLFRRELPSPGVAIHFLRLSHFYSFHLKMEIDSTASVGCTTGIAFEAGAVANQCKVAAFAAAVAFVALDAGGADAFEAEILG